MELVHCVYCSASSTKEFGGDQLADILKTSRANNARLEITGILLYVAGSFFQVLEGDRPTVETLFEKISRDPRHTRISKLIFEPISKRAFPHWSMGYPRITPQELASIPGLNDFFSAGISFIEIGEGRAKTLIEAFKEGRWRTRIDN